MLKATLVYLSDEASMPWWSLLRQIQSASVEVCLSESQQISWDFTITSYLLPGAGDGKNNNENLVINITFKFT